MAEFLLQLGTMSVQATVIVGVVLLLRFIFSKLHIAKKYTNLLWIIPYIAMIIPWGIKTPFSFWQITQEGQTKIEQAVNTMSYSTDRFMQTVIEPDVLQQMEEDRYAPPSIDKVIVADGTNDENIEGIEDVVEYVADSASTSVENTGFFSNLTTWDALVYAMFTIWLLGIVIFLMYGVASSLKLKKKLVCSLLLSENIYVADDIREPFVFGVFSPKIYLPCNLTKDNEYYVVEHEKTHIQRKDPVKKVIAFVITGIHWFNPFAYVAFHMMTKDMEMACDEETVQRIGIEQRKEYATALLKLSTKKRNLLIPVAFGEGNVKSRINNVLRYKKTLKIFAVLAAIVIVIVAAVFLTKPAAQTTTLSLVSGESQDKLMRTPKEANPREITVIYDGKETTFPTSYYDSFRVFLEDLVVRKEEVNKSRSEDRPAEIVIQIVGGTAYNFDENMETIWCDNGVKPSFTYEVVKPKMVLQFLEAQLSDYEAKEADSTEEIEQSEIEDNAEADTNMSGDIYIGDNVSYLDKVPRVIYSEDITEEDLCGENGPFLDYADDRYVVFHTLDWFYVYDMMKKDMIWGIGLDNIVDVAVDINSLKAYIYDQPQDSISIYECDIANESNGLISEMPTIVAFDDFLVTSECVQHDPTVYRTKECIQITDGRYLYLESGSGFLGDLRLIREDAKGNRTAYDVFILNSYYGLPKTIQMLSDAYYSETVDITHDGEMEYILIDIEEIQLDRQASAYLKIVNQNGRVIWQKEMFLAAAGWDSYFLVETEEGICLMQYLPILHQEQGNYSYRVFYLNEDGKEIEVAEDSINFRIYPYNVEVEAQVAIPKEELLQFAEDVNVYFEQGRGLISTVDGTLRYQTPGKVYIYEETYQALTDIADLDYSDSIALNITKFQNYYEKIRKDILNQQGVIMEEE